MKRSILMAASLVAILWFGTSPGLAQHGHAGGSQAGASGSHGPTGGNSPNVGKSSNTSGGDRATSNSATDLLKRNSNLDTTLTSKLQSKGLIPAGSDLKDVCSGFTTLGRCISAIHVSHNLRIPFDCLKDNLMGTLAPSGSGCPNGTGSSKMSLGRSIHNLRPDADAGAEVKKGQKAADADIKESESEAQTKSS